MDATTKRIVPLLDLKAQHAAIGDEVLETLRRVAASQQFILGEEVRKLEEEVAAYCGARHAIGCASGSEALLLSLMALGVGPGDEVLTTPFTFFATAGSISHLGARPVFADIREDTFNLDARTVEKALAGNPKIRAVIPVHLFGACADMDAISEVAKAYGVAVIEDAAQAIGAEDKGRRAGGIGLMGCLSFFPTKNLGGYGDGGMVTTNDPALAEKLAALRVHGSKVRYYHEWVGINSRLDALQAAVLRVKLPYLDAWTKRRQQNAALYGELLAGMEPNVVLPVVARHTTRHVWNQFTIRCQKRDALRAWLAERGIGSEIYYPLPLHMQQCFSDLGYKQGDFPVSEKVAEECLSLPIYPELSEEDLRYVAAAIRSFPNER
jgi:dTDP-4-amino-4,6-dideoxygalactose transaminase